MTATVIPFRLPLSSPLSTAKGTIDERRGFVFRVNGPEPGLGEATPFPGFTESLTACREALTRAETALRDGDWSDAFEAVTAAPERTPAARHAVALAYHDSLAKQKGVPLYSHFEGTDGAEQNTEPTPVPVNATIGDRDGDELVQAADAAFDQGFPAVKVKVGTRPIETDAERLRRVTSVATAGTTVRADANGAWSRERAGTFFDLIDPLDIEYVEQPLAPSDVEGHASLRRTVETPIALDESVVTRPLGRLLSKEAASYVVLKPMALGGPDVARAMAQSILEANRTPVISTTIDAVLARTAAVHVAASLPEGPPAGLATADRLERDLAPDPAPVESGTMRPPGKPGLGIGEVTIPDA
ncbi:MAG: mandelate racemase/muconate lactonizing enzyme family protein [Halodesulfurarchaeum sp.]